jgi:hypothetical protein
MWPFRRKREGRTLWQLGNAYSDPATSAGVGVTADTALRSAAV